MLIAGPAMVLPGVQVFSESPALFGWSSGFEAVLYFYAAMSMDPASFAAPGGDVRPWMDLLFLSFTTLPSTGLSDIVPLPGTPVAS